MKKMLNLGKKHSIFLAFLFCFISLPVNIGVRNKCLVGRVSTAKYEKIRRFREQYLLIFSASKCVFKTKEKVRVNKLAAVTESYVKDWIWCG